MRLSLLINPYVISFLDMENVVISISANEKFQVTEHSTFERNDFSTNKRLGCDLEEGGEEGRG